MLLLQRNTLTFCVLIMYLSVDCTVNDWAGRCFLWYFVQSGITFLCLELICWIMESQSKVTDPNGSISCVGGLSRSQGQRGGGGGGGVGGGGGWEREHLSAWWRHPAPACLKPSPVRNPPPARPHRPGGWIQTLWFGLSNPSRILNQLTKIISEHPGSWKRTLKTDSSRRNSFFFLFFIPAEMSFCPAWKDLRGGEERRRGMDPGGDNATRRRAAPCFTADIDALQIETIHSCFISNDVFWEEAAFVRKIDGCKLHRTTYSYWEW